MAGIHNLPRFDGRTALRADALNRLVDEVNRLRNIHGSGGINVTNNANGITLSSAGALQIVHGKIATTVTCDASLSQAAQKGTFQVWAVSQPSDPTTTEAADSLYPTFDVYPWMMADKTIIPYNTPTVAFQTGGRWYVMPPGPQYIGGTLAASLAAHQGAVNCNVTYGSTASTVSVYDLDQAFAPYPISSGRTYKAYWSPYNQRWEFLWIGC